MSASSAFFPQTMTDWRQLGYLGTFVLGILVGLALFVVITASVGQF